MFVAWQEVASQDVMEAVLLYVDEGKNVVDLHANHDKQWFVCESLYPSGLPSVKNKKPCILHFIYKWKGIRRIRR